MTFVLDASMTLSWHFIDEQSPARLAIADRAAAESVVVPALWFSELANGAIFAERKGRTTAAATADLLDLVRQLDVEVDVQADHHALHTLMSIARTHRLTIYDSAYFELAQRRGLPLATLDGKLARAAQTSGLEVLLG